MSELKSTLSLIRIKKTLTLFTYRAGNVCTLDLRFKLPIPVNLNLHFLEIDNLTGIVKYCTQSMNPNFGLFNLRALQSTILTCNNPSLLAIKHIGVWLMTYHTFLNSLLKIKEILTSYLPSLHPSQRNLLIYTAWTVSFWISEFS